MENLPLWKAVFRSFLHKRALRQKPDLTQQSQNEEREKNAQMSDQSKENPSK